jgi:phytoene dehydrogenase-like protein
MDRQSHTLVLGAGIGGLTAAALLLHAGHRVTVLEAHIYPGGSAGTFYHQKYLFDAGASLAGGFSPGGPHTRVAEILNLQWPVRSADPAWRVHLPDGRTITQWSDPARWREEWSSAFPESGKFWRTQEMLADISWDISSRPFPWPPQKARDFITLARALRPSTTQALPFLFRKVGDFAPTGDPMFATFLDGQLLISAQTTADRADALYGSAALDLPRRGVNHVQGGIGSLAKTLAMGVKYSTANTWIA